MSDALILHESVTVTEANSEWYAITNADEIPSPSLLLYPDRIEENFRRMISMAGGVENLRPHVKTHKMPQLIQMALSHGIHKFKAATIAEAEMTAVAGGTDILLAYQPVGPNIPRFITLTQRFPSSRFACLVDNPATVNALSAAAVKSGQILEVYVDLDVGMHRTGIPVGKPALELFERIRGTPGLHAAGLHAYDGHLHDHSLDSVSEKVTEAFDKVWKLRETLRAQDSVLPHLIASGTPTFALLAPRENVEVGCGTTVLWDFGQNKTTPYLDFLHAAVLLTRVISKPSPTRLCLDLGHKSVASEMPHPRVRLLGFESAQFVMHSEEHLVLESQMARSLEVGTVFYGIPRHVCPTVALQNEVAVVRGGRVTEWWPVVARARRISI